MDGETHDASSAMLKLLLTKQLKFYSTPLFILFRSVCGMNDTQSFKSYLLLQYLSEKKKKKFDNSKCSVLLIFSFFFL